MSCQVQIKIQTDTPKQRVKKKMESLNNNCVIFVSFFFGGGEMGELRNKELAQPEFPH